MGRGSVGIRRVARGTAARLSIAERRAIPISPRCIGAVGVRPAPSTCLSHRDRRRVLREKKERNVFVNHRVTQPVSANNVGVVSGSTFQHKLCVKHANCSHHACYAPNDSCNES